jgi:hypothetical protein
MDSDGNRDHAQHAVNLRVPRWQCVTPEPMDGTPAVYFTDDQMIESREMGQFILHGRMLLVIIRLFLPAYGSTGHSAFYT